MSRPSDCRAAAMASLHRAHMHSVLPHALPAVHLGTGQAPSLGQVHCPLVCLQSFLVPPACTAAQNLVRKCTTVGDHGQGRCPSVLHHMHAHAEIGQMLGRGYKADCSTAHLRQSAYSSMVAASLGSASTALLAVAVASWGLFTVFHRQARQTRASLCSGAITNTCSPRWARLGSATTVAKLQVP